MKCMAQSIITTHLITLYGDETAAWMLPRLYRLIEQYRGRIPAPAETSLSERDVILITYGDQVSQPGQSHLKTLTEFCNAHLSGVVTGIHILPFYPSSSDDGFSVKDYRVVNPALGEWADIERLGGSFRLMFDAVINHASVQGHWFQAFLRDEKPYRDYFLTIKDEPDLSMVVRPRTSPLLTRFQTAAGARRVWTTFSPDQADLDYHNPDVFLEILDILLTYAEHSAQFIRLDACAYLWKEIGTACINLPQTHILLQLIRAVLNEVAPHLSLITETNVPHTDNLSYFGNGTDEAQLVYNFTLPPLVMHTLRTGDATLLSQWASGLELPSDETTFLNFLASHDGIGLNPARGILSPTDIDALVAQTLANGGLVSYKKNIDGTQSPYELNISYFDALSNPYGHETLATQFDRFMAAHAIMLSLLGLPGIYFHSMFGSQNWLDGVKATKKNRTINRQKLERGELDRELDNSNSLRSQVLARFQQLLKIRTASAAFHPHGRQRILNMGTPVFAMLRSSPRGDKQVLCLQNVTSQKQSVGKYILEPYQTLWLDNTTVLPPLDLS